MGDRKTSQQTNAEDLARNDGVYSIRNNLKNIIRWGTQIDNESKNFFLMGQMQGGREKDEWKMTVGESLSHLVKSGVLLRSGKQGGEEWEEREFWSLCWTYWESEA